MFICFNLTDKEHLILVSVRPCEVRQRQLQDGRPYGLSHLAFNSTYYNCVYVGLKLIYNHKMWLQRIQKS